MNLGLLIIVISLLGYASNWFNWRYLNYSFVRLLYYLGAVVHESSHAFFCLLTGAKILDFKVFSKSPHVTHYKSKLPILGDILISLAPIIGGLFVLFLINEYLLKNNFSIPYLYNAKSILEAPLKVLSQINFLNWKSWIILLFFLNIGAMIGPSWQDLKNIWPAIIVLLFINSTWLSGFCLLAIILILTNLLIQIALTLLIETIKKIHSFFIDK